MEITSTDEEMKSPGWTEDHMEEFKECMDSYNIMKGSESFDTIELTIAFYECRCNYQLAIL